MMEVFMTVLSEKVAVDRLVLWFDGTFDASEAWQLRHVLDETSTGTSVTLDFSRIREFHDFAFALLAQDLRRADEPASRIRLEARGLRQHQLRLLKYLGFSTEESSIPEPDDATEPVEVLPTGQPSAELQAGADELPTLRG
jgi:anti-anti-sigma regulatory factor